MKLLQKSKIRAVAAWLGIVLSAVNPGYAGAQTTAPTTPSSADVQAAQAAGSFAASALGSLSVQTDSTGAPVTNSAGQPVVQQTGPTNQSSQLAMFQALTGVQTAAPTASPGNNQAGAATVAASGYFDFRCVNPMHLDQGADGVFVKVDGCSSSGAVVRVCSATASGQGTCSTDSSYSAAQTVAPGSYATVGGVQLGLGCNAQNQCRITVSTDAAFGGNDTSLKAGAQQAAATASSDSYVGLLQNAGTTNDYAGQIKTTGASLAQCAQKNAAGASTGTYTSCDGSNTVQTTSTQNSAACTGTPTCLKWEQNNQPYTRSCSVSLPLTNLATSYQYNSTKTCTVTQTTGANGQQTTSSTCTSSDLSGMTKVGATQPICSQQQSGSTSCTQTQWTEYWVNVASPTVSGTSASPTPVSGACDSGPSSTSSSSICLNNNWFGRTLPATSCEVPYVDESTGLPSSTGAVQNLDYTTNPGCGFCLTPQTNVTCQGSGTATSPSDTCSTANLAGCTLTSSTPQQTIGPVVVSQTQTYTCNNPTPVCMQWSSGSDNNCLNTNLPSSVANLGGSNPSADGSLNNAMVGAAILDSTAQGMGKQSDASVPKVFGGDNLRCRKPLGFIGGFEQQGCCDINLQRPTEGGVVQNGCSMDEAKLAAARRSFYATYVGSYCSACIKVFGHCVKCTQQTDSYCAFPGILPRLVQEQGRPQLAQMVSSSVGATSQSAPFGFNFYDSSSGSWSAPVTVNGVQFSAWQWPSYCSDPQKASDTFLANPAANSCPSGLLTWVAACDLPGGCGALPSQPTDSSSGQWEITSVDPLKDVTSAVSKYGAVTGACSPTNMQCSYTASAWPVGQGGRAEVTRDFTWALFNTEQQGSVQQDSSAYTLNNLGDFMFKGYSVAGQVGGQLPASIRLDYSSDGGQTWKTFSLPTTALANSQAALPGTDITATGSCDALSNACTFRFTGTVAVTAKPWGSAQNPDCTGFTAGQLAVLDFGKMDLSEFINSVMNKVQGQVNSQVLGQQASQQASAYESVFSGSNASPTETAHPPVSANFARAIPAEGFGPFNVTLDVSGYWPQTTGNPKLDTDVIQSAMVDWDDCSPAEVLTPLSASSQSTLDAVSGSGSGSQPTLTGTQGTGFQDVHTIPAPDQLTCKGSPHANVTHNVTITVVASKSGKHVVTLRVENAWATYPGANSNNSFVGQSVTGSSNVNNTPTPPAAQ